LLAAAVRCAHAVLFGDVPSSGRLPFTLPAHPQQLPFTPAQWPGLPAPVYQQDQPTDVMGANGFSTYSEKLLIGHRWYDQHGLVPAFCFGHGLPLSSFAYSELSGDVHGVAFTLRNTGKRPAIEVPREYSPPPPLPHLTTPLLCSDPSLEPSTRPSY
jgi:beta-glucosidase